MKTISREEYEVLKELDDKWKWIAKIRGMGLVAFDIAPRKYGNSKDWAYARSSQRKELDRNLLQFVEYDDDYPYSIADLIEEYEDSKEYKDSLVIEYFLDKAKESEETEMKKDLDWVIQEIQTTRKVLADSESSGNETADEFAFNNGKEEGLVIALKLLDQLDEPDVTLDKAFEKVAESHPMTKEEICRHLERLVSHGGKVTYGETETLSDEWIDEHTWNNHYVGRPFVYVDDLQNLLVPKQEELVKLVEDWSIDRNLHEADSSKQFLKVIEEIGEVADALAKNKPEELKDGIGDTIVTLIILAQQNGLTIEECLQTAYNEIADRKGEMVNGIFVKEEDLPRVE